MAEDFDQRTEAPTQRRREEAREQGRTAVSMELTVGALMLAAIGGLWFASRSISAGLMESVRHGLLHCRVAELSPERTREVLANFLMRGLHVTGWLLGLLFVTALAAMVGQVGFHIVPALAAPNWERVNPINGLGRMFSRTALQRGGSALAKATLTGVLAALLLKGRLVRLAALDQQPLASAAGQIWSLVLRLSLMIAAAFVIVGVIDYFFQRMRFESQLRMTRTELKDEVKREEGDPAIKGRIRKLARELSQRRMMRDVPRATVVVTNPTHLAIALCYEKGTLGAPKVVAKGAGHVARKIVETARRHGVPVVERKPVAQALYKAVSIGQEIPAALYHAVAEVLAYVYRLRGIA